MTVYRTREQNQLKVGPIKCTLFLNMSYYVSQFDIGTDLQQPHNFVKINGMFPLLHMPQEYHKQPNYKKIYQWINPTKLGSSESYFDSVFIERKFQNGSATIVIINVSTAQLKMEFLKNDLAIKTDDSKQKQLETSLLVFDWEAVKSQSNTIWDPKKPKKPKIRIFNLKNGSGEICIYSFFFNIKVGK